METSSVKTTEVEGGTYAMSSTLNLTSKDNGETFTAAPGQTPVLSGQNSLQSLIAVNGAQNVTLQGLTLENASAGSNSGALTIEGGASGTQVTANHFLNNAGDALLAMNSSNSTVSGNEFDSSGQSAVEDKTEATNAEGTTNDVYANNVVNGAGSQYGAFYLHGTVNAQVTNNLVENTPGSGIGLSAIGGYTGSPTVYCRNTGTLVSGNTLTNTDTNTSDNGAIYVIDRTGQDTGIQITGNEINGASSSASNPHVIGIYLDDYSSGVSVSNNIVRGVQGSDVQLHGGKDDSFSNNIFDMSGVPNSQPAALLQAAPSDITPNSGSQAATNDSFSHNVFLSDQSSPTAYENLGLSPLPNSSDNLYFDLKTAFTSSLDSAPHTGNPDFTNAAGNDYSLQPGSAASSVGFAAISQGSMGPHPTGPYWSSSSGTAVG